MNKKIIALEPVLKKYENIITLGVKPNFSDYTKDEADLIIKADKIYFPSIFYADLLDGMGKKTFPSYHTYKYALDKIKQTAIFQMLNIPHPKTRVFYGKKQKTQILDYFKFPFIAKIPRGSGMGEGVFLIENEDDLKKYFLIKSPAYIQEYLPCDRDIRVVIIGNKPVLAYYRIGDKNDFRNNISQGGEIVFDNIPEEAVELALYTAEKCSWDNVGIDVIQHKGEFYILEGNIKYGKKGFEAAGINYKDMLYGLINEGLI